MLLSSCFEKTKSNEDPLVKPTKNPISMDEPGQTETKDYDFDFIYSDEDERNRFRETPEETPESQETPMESKTRRGGLRL